MSMNPSGFANPRGVTIMFKTAKRAGALAIVAAASLAAGVPAGRAATTEAEQVRPVFSNELPNVPGKTLTAVEVNYAPGASSKPHHHGGVVFAYVVSGQIRSQVDDGPARVYHAGESFFEGPGAHHVISENASATKPARLLAVIVADKGEKLLTPDQ
jgi:quercetin dioxygenase-like cupin family protein